MLEEALAGALAQKENEKKEVDPHKYAEIDIDGTTYRFEVDREVCVKMERDGYSLIKMATSPLQMQLIAFKNGLKKNHSITDHEANLLWDKIGEKYPGANNALAQFVMRKYQDFSVASQADTSHIKFG